LNCYRNIGLFVALSCGGIATLEAQGSRMLEETNRVDALQLSPEAEKMYQALLLEETYV